MVVQIITEIVFEVVPKISRVCRVAMDEDNGKEVVHAISSAHVRGILQALDPFIVILKQTPALTCLLESVI